MRALKIAGHVFVFTILTILTQIGGIVYLVNLVTYKVTNEKIKNRFLRGFTKIISFLFLYLITTFAIVPMVANIYGRVPMPFTTTNHLRPANVLTCFLNRHYVTTKLREVTFSVALSMSQNHPGTVVNYLDANFPFIDNFPLIPHLSHNDGEKIDLSFYYTDSKTGKPTNDVPSIIGYGICEEPFKNEINLPNECEQKGFWQYSLLRKIMPQGNKKDFSFNALKTGELINFLSAKDEIGKIFIEPHLKTRLHLNNVKVRFHGCQAVRHDDHIHVQLK